MYSELNDLQSVVMADARKIYSEVVIVHAMNPRNLGTMQNFDGFGRITGPCGDTMEVWLKEKGNTITDIYFMTDGCGTSIPSSSPDTTGARTTTVWSGHGGTTFE